MNIDTRRKLDRWAGTPLTFLLSGFHLLGRRQGRSGKARPRRILFIGLSDPARPVLADPAMKRIAAASGAVLYFVASRKNREGLDLLHTVRPSSIFTLRDANVVLAALDMLRFVRWSRRQKIDTVVDLELFSRFSALLSGLSGAGNRVGFHRYYLEGLYRGGFLTHRVCYNPHIHTAANYIALANSLLTEEAEVPYSKKAVRQEETALPVMLYHENELTNMHEQVRRHYPKYERNRHRLVLVDPHGDDQVPQRRWMPERYAELILRILETAPDVLVLLTGAPADKEDAAILCQMVGSGRCINFTGALQPARLPVLCSIALLMVGNYSGHVHFSAITKLPSYILFGPDTPVLYGSLGISTGISAGLACSPCLAAANHFTTPCRDNKCLQKISVDQVLGAIKPLLQAQEGGSPDSGSVHVSHHGATTEAELFRKNL